MLRPLARVHAPRDAAGGGQEHTQQAAADPGCLVAVPLHNRDDIGLAPGAEGLAGLGRDVDCNRHSPRACDRARRVLRGSGCSAGHHGLLLLHLHGHGLLLLHWHLHGHWLLLHLHGLLRMRIGLLAGWLHLHHRSRSSLNNYHAATGGDRHHWVEGARLRGERQRERGSQELSLL